MSETKLFTRQQSTESAGIPANEVGKFAPPTPPPWRRAGTLILEAPADEGLFAGKFTAKTPPTWRRAGPARHAPLRRAVLLMRASRSVTSLNQGLRPGFGSMTSLPRSLGSSSSLRKGLGSSLSLHNGLGSNLSLYSGMGSNSTLHRGPGSTTSQGSLKRPINCCCCGKPAPDDVTMSKTPEPEEPEELRAGQRNADGSLTPAGLAWRTLHVGRAKLRAAATTSELLFGFAMIALVELQINQPTHVPEGLFVLFSASSTLLVALHIFALMISTYILPNIDVVTRLHPSALLEESPHHKMKLFVEMAWAFSTVFGMFLFLFEVTLLAWMKFWDYALAASITATVIVVPAIGLFVGFAVHFYHTLVVHKCDVTSSDLEQLEVMRRKLETVDRKEDE